MKSSRATTFILSLAIFAGGLWLGSSESAKLNDARTSLFDLQDKLGHAIIPSLELKGVPLDQAVARLNREIGSLQMGSRKPMFVIWKQGDPVPPGLRWKASIRPATIESAPEIPGLPSESSERGALSISVSDSQRQKEITTFLHKIPVIEAARYFADLTDHSLLAAGNVVYFYPPEILAQILQEKEFYLLSPASFGRSHGIALDSQSNRIDLKPFFVASGVRFPPDGYAYHEPSKEKVVVATEPDELDFVECFFGGGCTGIPAVSSRLERVQVKAGFIWNDLSARFRSP